MVEPLHADLPARAVPHGLFDVIAGLIAEQAVHPDAELVFGLCPELLLAVQGPAQQPGRILHRDDAAGDGAAAEGVALADLLDIPGDLLIQRRDGGAFPVAQLRLAAELFRVAEGVVQRGDALPEVPSVARLDGGVEARGLVLCADGAALHAAAVGDKEQVVLGEVDGLHRALVVYRDARRLLFARLEAELDVHDLCVVVELDAVVFQVGDHGQDDGLVLVIPGEAEGREVGQTADVVDIPLEVELHLEGAVPVLESEHGAPVEPEVGVEHLIVKKVGDLFVLKLLVGGEEELHDLHRALIRQAELAVGVGVLAPVHGSAAEGIVGVGLVQPVILVQHTGSLGLQRRDGAEQIPHDLEVVVHLTAAPHHIAHVVLVAVAGTAGQGVFFKNVYPLPLHLAIPHQIAGCRQGRQAAADDISRFAIHAFGLAGPRKGFVIAAGIIHRRDLHFVLYRQHVRPRFVWFWHQYTPPLPALQQTKPPNCRNFWQMDRFA